MTSLTVPLVMLDARVPSPGFWQLFELAALALANASGGPTSPNGRP